MTTRIRLPRADGTLEDYRLGEPRMFPKASLAAAGKHSMALIACGCGTDQLQPGPDVTTDDVVRA